MSDTANQPQPGARADGKVNVLLAHPLNPERDLARLRLDPDTPCNVGDIVTVDSYDAQALIGAGFAQVDPEDKEAVARYVTPPTEGVAPAENVAPAPGQTEPDESAAQGQDGGEELKGEALEKALEKRGLPKTGTADEKRAAVAEYDASHVADPVTPTA